jgi:hypothetical protein
VQAAKPCAEHEPCDENHCKTKTPQLLF